MSISVIPKSPVSTRTFVGLAFFALCVSAYAQPVPRGAPGAGPIGYTAHGGIFDSAGNEIAPSLAFIETAQAWYRDRLLARISKQDRTRFEAMERRISTGLTVDPQSKLAAQTELLRGLVDQSKHPEAAHIRGKLNALGRLLATKFPEATNAAAATSSATTSVEKFKLHATVQQRINTDPLLKQFRKSSNATKMLLVTNTSGAAYRSLCASHGVPLPQDFGPGSPWVSKGTIAAQDLFIVRSISAEVLAFESASPPGMCVALPRFDSSNTVQADGVICFGTVADPLGGPPKACFWDNQVPSAPVSSATFTFQRGAAQSILQFAGGSDLRAQVGNVCSDCHAGENPLIIHGPVLSSLAASFNTFPANWYEPIVRTGDVFPWPENPGPMNSPPLCTTCHGTWNAKGFAGRLPHLSTDLARYCGATLRGALGAMAPPKDFDPVTNPNPLPPNPPFAMPQGGTAQACTPSMPSGDPRFVACTAAHSQNCTPAFVATDPRNGVAKFNVSCTPQIKTLLDWCGSAPAADASTRGDPHIKSIGGVPFDFQSAGEFVYLRSGLGMEVQTRQTAVATASPVGPNAHTGLTSCVSINTAMAARVGNRRVTLQPPENPEFNARGLELRVDGKLVKLGDKALDLGNGGRVIRVATTTGTGAIEIRFPDKTRLIATTDFWGAPNNVWYMNVDVTNTPGRDGVMGAIPAGTWLPLLSDGSSIGPRPASLAQRYVDLNQTFADSWRVSSVTSLFDYAPGTDTKTFTRHDWPPEKPPCVIPESKVPVAEGMPIERAKIVCAKVADKAMNAQCVADVAATGNAGFAKTYLATQSLQPQRARPLPVAPL